MSDTSASEAKLVQLKRKLDAAISSRASLESDLKSQSSMLIDFIGKLSQTCKGQDVTLDNKLANLRNLFKKSAPLSEIETQISTISIILKKHSATNETNIRALHHDILTAGQSLQKTNGLPNDLRRELRTLLQESEAHKDAVIQYIPILSKLITFYRTAFLVKNDISEDDISEKNIEEKKLVDKKLINKFSTILNELALSDVNTKQISTIKSKLNRSMSNDNLLDRFFEIFDIIVIDLKNERNTAKAFLSTLSNTLATVQSAVKTTLELNIESNKKQDKLNGLLQKQIGEMTSDLGKATSLSNIKIDINEKLTLIASTLQKKSELEVKQQNALNNQMKDMANKVEQLEQQSKTYEKRIKEQQDKSMQDALTKLANRASFDDFYAKAMIKYNDMPYDLAIVVLDLDDFKRINDTYGHIAGDKTLQVIANTLKKHMSQNAFIARYGGEEFVLVMTNTDKKLVLQSLELIRIQVERLPFKFKNDKVTMTMSIGATHINANDNIHTAFERADEALYKAKAQGKNQVIYV